MTNDQEGRMVRQTVIKVHYGTGDVSPEILGWGWGTDPVTGNPRKIWGLADMDGRLSSISYLWDEVASPAAMLNSLAKRGDDRFTFHAGVPIWTPLEELRRAFQVLGMAAPETYLGVPVPGELFANWDQVEAMWWRRGVETVLGLSMEAFVDAKVAQRARP